MDKNKVIVTTTTVLMGIERKLEDARRQRENLRRALVSVVLLCDEGWSPDYIAHSAEVAIRTLDREIEEGKG